MKYALIKNNIVVQISYPFVEGWEKVDQNVFAGMIKKADGTFDNTDEVKKQIANEKQQLINKENKKKSALAKLKKLGLDEDEIKALF